MKIICDYNNCNNVGKYKAPIERDNSKKYKWLCLEHIKEFNKTWDYFKGMSDEDVIKFLKSDMTWHRPTQGFSSPDNFFNILWKNTLTDHNDILKNSFDRKNDALIKFSEKDKEAFRVIDLKIGSKWQIIQDQFKKLVKKYHPDMNAGNKKFEEKLKMITLAYTQLKMTYRVK